MSFFDFIINNRGELLSSLIRHIELVSFSVLIGMVIAIPGGIILARYKKAARLVLGAVSLVQTIPGLVMLGFALIIFGTGFYSALIVLSLYSILPVLQNTYTGISEVEARYTDAGRGIGMTRLQLLFKVQLPLALPTVISGIRISTIYIVSWATLAGLIGAGGLGDMIWTGLSTYNTNYILAGALPSAALAFAYSGLISLLQNALTPRGLRRQKV